MRMASESPKLSFQPTNKSLRGEMMESHLSIEDIVHREMNRIRGRLAGAIEACGLDERQERGAINTLKSLSYDSEAVIVEAINTLK